MSVEQSTATHRIPFLTAQWRNLAMLHYEVDPRVLSPFVPAGTELDTWKDRHFMSVVGFEFRNTRLRGFRVPFHANFEEVNLRFYVRRRVGPEWRPARVSPGSNAAGLRKSFRPSTEKRNISGTLGFSKV